MMTYEKQTTMTENFIEKDKEDGRDDTVVFVRNSNFSLATHKHSVASSPRLGSHELGEGNQIKSVKLLKGAN